MTSLKKLLVATVAASAVTLASGSLMAQSAQPLRLAQMTHGDKGMQTQAPQGSQTAPPQGQTMPGMQSAPGTAGQGKAMPGGMGEHGMRSQMQPQAGTVSGPSAQGQTGNAPMTGGMAMMGCGNGMCPAPRADSAGMQGMGMMGSQGTPGMMQMMMQRRMADIPSDRIDGRIAFLRAELRITPAQTAAWTDVENALRANAKRVADMQPASGQGATSALDRADQQERMLALRLDVLRALKPAYAKLYAVLDDSQKKTADELMPPYLGLM